MQYSGQNGQGRSEIFPVSYWGLVLPCNFPDKNITYQISKLNIASDIDFLDKANNKSESYIDNTLKSYQVTTRKLHVPVSPRIL